MADTTRQTGRTQRMLVEALQFVEPEGKPFRLTIVGQDAAHAQQLMSRFTTMILAVNYRITKKWERRLQVGNTLISFLSGKDPKAAMGCNVFTTFEDHTVHERDPYVLHQ